RDDDRDVSGGERLWIDRTRHQRLLARIVLWLTATAVALRRRHRRLLRRSRLRCRRRLRGGRSHRVDRRRVAEQSGARDRRLSGTGVRGRAHPEERSKTTEQATAVVGDGLTRSTVGRRRHGALPHDLADEVAERTDLLVTLCVLSESTLIQDQVVQIRRRL